MEFLCLVFVIALVSRVNGQTNPAGPVAWCYNDAACGPSTWATDDGGHPTCGGSKQSPIDLQPVDGADDNLESFHFVHFISFNADDLSSQDWTITNNGHAIQINLLPLGILETRGGGLDDTYTAAQFHFHFGKESDRGSEHALNGVKFPMEMHIVHYRNDVIDNPSSDATLADPTSYLVLGVFFEISEEDNANIAPFIKAVDGLVGKDINTQWPAEPFDLFNLMPVDLSKFYRYEGSLTTPGCNECVVWSHFADTVKISEAQMNVIRATGIADNFRPLQEINGRIVTQSF